MPATTDHKHSFRPLAIVLLALIFARTLFILLMPAVYSKDLFAWLHVIDVLEASGNPYRDTSVLNWPPFWMQVIFVIGKLAKYTHLSAILLFQVTLIVVEVISATLCYCLVRKFFSKTTGKGVFVAALALNPISIFLNCQHCNFDVFVGLWVLLFAWALMAHHTDGAVESWLAACFFLGMGIFTKTIPVFLSPLLLAGVRYRKVSTTLFGGMLLLTPVVIGMGVIYTLAPWGVKENVLGYRSMGGWYGITGLLGVLGIKGGNEVYGALAPWLMLFIMLLTTWRVRTKASLSPDQLITTMLTLLVFLPTFGPGYSPPYILWFLPLLPIYYTIASPRTRKTMLVGFAVVALTYITEYGFFASHGAFMKAFDRSEHMSHLSDVMGTSHSQTLIRLPMFASYIIFFILLLRDRNNVLTSRA